MASRYSSKKGSKFRFPSLRRSLRWGSLLLLVLILIDVGYLVGIWPQWELYRKGPIERSSFIRDYESERHKHPDWPKLRWNPVSIETIPQAMLRAVIAAEDSRFYEHDGVDLEAFKEAMVRA